MVVKQKDYPEQSGTQPGTSDAFRGNVEFRKGLLQLLPCIAMEDNYVLKAQARTGSHRLLAIYAAPYGIQKTTRSIEMRIIIKHIIMT